MPLGVPIDDAVRDPVDDDPVDGEPVACPKHTAVRLPPKYPLCRDHEDTLRQAL
jgi:hypothetical protein